MIRVDFTKLNELEKEIHHTLNQSVSSGSTMTIGQAAEICGCSTSKISKFVKKLGFLNYKQYMQFLHNHDLSSAQISSELERLKRFIEDFDSSLVEEFSTVINSYQKVILFGHGPSYLAAQYFEYKLRLSTNKSVTALSEELMVNHLLDDSSLLIILTTTGTFRSFANLYHSGKKSGAKVLVLCEEYRKELTESCDQLIWLSRHPQPEDLKPHEKSRTVFYIFIEEVAQYLRTLNRSNNVSSS